MGTVKDAEFKVILDLTELLNQNADKVKSGETKVCLTTSSLSILGACFRRYSDGGDRREEGEAGPSNWIARLRQKKVVIDHEKWREYVRTLYDFIIKIKSLKIILGSNTLKAPVQIARFQALQVLEVKKVPIHMVEGLSKLRGQLKDLTINRCAQSLQDILEICGGDRSSGFVWTNLKTVFVSFNGFKQLDNSLRFIPFVEVLDLSHNNIHTTEDFLQHLTDIIKINFGFNMLTSIPQLSYSNKGKLKTLVLRNNNLDNLEGIQELKLLEELDVTENCLIEHSILHVLSLLDRLTVLCLMGNPLYYTSNHRLKTLEHISATVRLGEFMLDGHNLSADEVFIHRKNRYNGGTDHIDGSTTIVTDPQSSDDPLIVIRTPTKNSASTSQLTPGTPHSEKKKRGHKRVKSKERVPKIADMTDSLMESYSCSIETPYGSSKEEENIAAQVEIDKKKIEIMRKHYKDDWLKALSADQGKAAKSDTRRVNTDNDSSMDINVDNVANSNAEGTENKTVSDLSNQASEHEKEVTEESKDKQEQKDTTRPTVTPKSPEEAVSPVIKIEQTTDIYAFSRMESRDVCHEIQTKQSFGDSLEQYGEESDPFIVMLPDHDMNHLIITVNNRYLIEKNLNGERREDLDLKFLKGFLRSKEELSGRDISAGIAFTVVTLTFDYARKDMRERRYAMEDETFADKLESLLSSHLRKEAEDMVECLKCQYQFPKSQSVPRAMPTCPKCNSKMLIKVEKSIIDLHQATNINNTDSHESAEEMPPPKTRLQRQAAYRPKHKQVASGVVERHTVSEHPSSDEMKSNNSWSDVHAMEHSTRGSVSSVESDITILGSNKSGANISQSSHNSLLETNSELLVSATDQNSSPIQTSLEKHNSSASKDMQNSSLKETSENLGWIKDKNEQLTPVGSPLSNSVCSSMISSVYENTISGTGIKTDNGSGENTQNSSFTSSSADSVSIRHSCAVDKKAKSRNRNAALFRNCADETDGIVGDGINKSDSSISTVPSVSISDVSEDKSSHSIYDADSVDGSLEISNVSTDVSQNISNNCHSSPLKPQDSERKSPAPTHTIDSSVDIYHHSERLSDFPADVSPIKRSGAKRSRGSRNRSAVIFGDESWPDVDTSRRANKRSAVILDDESWPSEKSIFSDASQALEETSDDIDKEESKDSLSVAEPLPWEQGIAVTDMPHGGVNLDEFRNVDHRIQLYLELKVFQAEEVCQCAIQCDIVQYMKVEPVKSLLAISSHRLLIFQMEGEQEGNVASDWLKCYEDQPIAELRYIDIGLGYQSLRIEFNTTCSSFSLLIADESRCKNFLALLTDIVHNLDHSRLEGISKSNPDTLKNVDIDILLREERSEAMLEEEEEEEQTLIRYLIVKYADEDIDSESGSLLSLAVTNTDLVLINENFQWPLPRLQAPLSDMLKTKQFSVVRREKINNIESLMFNEYNPKELRLSFFETSDVNSKPVWMISMETTGGVKSFVDAIRDPWEEEFGVSLDVTSTSFTDESASSKH